MDVEEDHAAVIPENDDNDDAADENGWRPGLNAFLASMASPVGAVVDRGSRKKVGSKGPRATLSVVLTGTRSNFVCVLLPITTLFRDVSGTWWRFRINPRQRCC